MLVREVQFSLFGVRRACVSKDGLVKFPVGRYNPVSMRLHSDSANASSNSRLRHSAVSGASFVQESLQKTEGLGAIVEADVNKLARTGQLPAFAIN